MALGNRNRYIRLLDDSGASRISLVELLFICRLICRFMISYVFGFRMRGKQRSGTVEVFNNRIAKRVHAMRMIETERGAQFESR